MLRTLACALGLFASASGAASGQPLRLHDPSPRWVGVQFEVSPPERPGQLDAVYTRRVAAWYEPIEGFRRARVTVAGALVESSLLANHDPEPGSFSDFVWTFDAATGHVHSASLEGRLRQRIVWGPFGLDVETEVQVEMDTRREAGFRSARRLLGHQVFPYCDASDRGDCQRVPAQPFDPNRGYVNAVGRIAARTGAIRVESFSPLGEAIFTELVPRPRQADDRPQAPAGRAQ